MFRPFVQWRNRMASRVRSRNFNTPLPLSNLLLAHPSLFSAQLCARGAESCRPGCLHLALTEDSGFWDGDLVDERGVSFMASSVSSPWLALPMRRCITARHSGAKVRRRRRSSAASITWRCLALRHRRDRYRHESARTILGCKSAEDSRTQEPAA
jgi:hypothetical protein